MAKYEMTEEQRRRAFLAICYGQGNTTALARASGLPRRLVSKAVWDNEWFSLVIPSRAASIPLDAWRALFHPCYHYSPRGGREFKTASNLRAWVANWMEDEPRLLAAMERRVREHLAKKFPQILKRCDMAKPTHAERFKPWLEMWASFTPPEWLFA